MSQATQAVHDLNLIFFVIKQAKMDFVFKLSFLLHRVTNQNFKKKKKAKLLITNTAKVEEKSLRGCVSEEKCELRYQFFFFLSTAIRKVVNVVSQRVLN